MTRELLQKQWGGGRCIFSAFFIAIFKREVGVVADSVGCKIFLDVLLHVSDEKNPGCLGYIGDYTYPVMWVLY